MCPVYIILISFIIVVAWFLYQRFARIDFSKLPTPILRQDLYTALQNLVDVIDQTKQSKLLYYFDEWIANEDLAFVRYKEYIRERNSNDYAWSNFQRYRQEALDSMQSLVEYLDKLKIQEANALTYRVFAVSRSYKHYFIHYVCH